MISTARLSAIVSLVEQSIRYFRMAQIADRTDEEKGKRTHLVNPGAIQLNKYDSSNLYRAGQGMFLIN